MFEPMDGRVRAGPLGAGSAGKSRQHDVGETVVSGAVALVTIAVTKVTRAQGLLAESRQGCRCDVRGTLDQGVHFLCAWIDMTTPNPVNRVIAEVPP